MLHWNIDNRCSAVNLSILFVYCDILFIVPIVYFQTQGCLCKFVFVFLFCNLRFYAHPVKRAMAESEIPLSKTLKLHSDIN